MRIDATALPGFARKTAETVSDFATVVHNLVLDLGDSYRPELHYMCGPGPKSRAKHQPWPRLNRDVGARHLVSPVHIRRGNAANSTQWPAEVTSCALAAPLSDLACYSAPRFGADRPGTRTAIDSNS